MSNLTNQLKQIKELMSNIENDTKSLIPYLNNALEIPHAEWLFDAYIVQGQMVAEWRLYINDFCDAFVRFNEDGTSFAFCRKAQNEIKKGLRDWQQGVELVVVEPRIYADLRNFMNNMERY
jgi:hypothetical protein